MLELVTMVFPRVIWLEDPECQNALLVGQKAANLSKLASSFRVPLGFCVSSGVPRTIRAGGKTGPRNSLDTETASQLRRELATAYNRLSRRCRAKNLHVAVRSSVVDEDSETASFAGVHETFLNITGLKAITRAVIDCLISATSKGALAYRRVNAISATTIRAAVLVQRFVQAETSSVLFTANPVTGRRSEVIVTACWGLGESLAKGTVTPDTFIVRKKDRSLISQSIADKKIMTIALRERTREVAINKDIRTKACIDQRQLMEVVKLGLAVESYMGFPVDVECAFSGHELHLLQCRPITTLN